jgi:GNAT superfamily N-acetyltransferase
MDDVTYRWIDGPTATQEEWDRIELILAARGWMSLNQGTSRILVAEHEGRLAGFFVFQMVAHAGPFYVRPDLRGTEIGNELADRMAQFFADSRARGVVIVADNPIAAQMCVERGMLKVSSPVFVLPGAEV